MSTNEDREVTGTVGELIVQKITNPKDGPAFTQAYLRAGFLTSAVDALFHARRRAGLTQGDVAQRLGTKQPAIARWEADTEGSMSLRRYVDVALACDAVPLIMLAPKQSVLTYIRANPEAPRTADDYMMWHLQGPTESGFPMQAASDITKPASSVPTTADYFARFISSGRAGVELTIETKDRPSSATVTARPQSVLAHFNLGNMNAPQPTEVGGMPVRAPDSTIRQERETTLVTAG